MNVLLKRLFTLSAVVLLANVSLLNAMKRAHEGDFAGFVVGFLDQRPTKKQKTNTNQSSTESNEVPQGQEPTVLVEEIQIAHSEKKQDKMPEVVSLDSESTIDYEEIPSDVSTSSEESIHTVIDEISKEMEQEKKDTAPQPKKPVAVKKVSFNKPTDAAFHDDHKKSNIFQIMNNNRTATLGVMTAGAVCLGIANAVSDPVSTITAGVGLTSLLGGFVTTGYKYVSQPESEIKTLQIEIAETENGIEEHTRRLNTLLDDARRYSEEKQNLNDCMKKIMENNSNGNMPNALESGANIQQLLKKHTEMNLASAECLLLISQKKYELLAAEIRLLNLIFNLNSLIKNKKLEKAISVSDSEQCESIRQDWEQKVREYVHNKKALLAQYNQEFQHLTDAQQTCNLVLSEVIQ